MQPASRHVETGGGRRRQLQLREVEHRLLARVRQEMDAVGVRRAALREHEPRVGRLAGGGPVGAAADPDRVARHRDVMPALDGREGRRHRARVRIVPGGGDVVLGGRRAARRQRRGQADPHPQ